VDVQVTNPPIDPLREGLVMSLNMRLGSRGSLLTSAEVGYQQIMLRSPVLLETDLTAIKQQDKGDACVKTEVMPAFFKAGKDGSLKEALTALCDRASEAARSGVGCLIITDRTDGSMQPEEVPVPTLLAVGAIHHRLIADGRRSDTSIVAETAQCFSTHHVAVLVGYGAHAVCPYLAFETCRQWRGSKRTESLIKSGRLPDVSMRRAQRNYKAALEKGVKKILSKMGISLLSCYHGAQIFEVYGLGPEVIDTAFRGSVSRIGGLSFADLQRETEAFWAKGFPDKSMSKLEDYGFIQSKPRGEYHANNQVMAKLLHKAIGLGGNDRDGGAYRLFSLVAGTCGTCLPHGTMWACSPISAGSSLAGPGRDRVRRHGYPSMDRVLFFLQSFH
jgi:glutamate synthase (ferredoxin)